MWSCRKLCLCLGAESRPLLLSIFITFFPIWERPSWIEPPGQPWCYTTNWPLVSLQELALLTWLLRPLSRGSDHPRCRDLWEIARCQLIHGITLSSLKGNGGNIALAHQTPSTICLLSNNLILCLRSSGRPASPPATVLSCATVVLFSCTEFEGIHPCFELP